MIAREISSTIPDFRKWFPIVYLGGNPAKNQFLVYAGEQQGEMEWGHLLPWYKALDLI